MTAAAVSAGKPPLPAMAPGGNTVQLEIMMVERSSDDPLLRDRLWNEVDQLGAGSPDIRNCLQHNGLRIGTVGAMPPPTLQTLLGIGSKLDSDLGDKGLMAGRRLTLPSGMDTEISAGEPLEQCDIREWAHGDITEREFKSARCILRVRPIRLQDGWVKVEFVPEIHHGDAKMRHAATDAGWQLTSGQQVESFESEKFAVTLSVGEMAVVGTDNASATRETLGDWFFGTPLTGRRKERLLVIRLAEMHSPETSANNAGP